MSGDTGRQSSSEVAHEAEDTRAHLASTLEQLRDNLKPANVMEEVVSNARIGASAVADNLVAFTKAYPLPTVLFGAGAALVLGVTSKGLGRSSKSGVTAEGLPRALAQRNPVRIPAAPGRTRMPRSSASSGLAGAASAVKESLRGLVSDRTSKLSDGGGGLKQQAPKTYDLTSSNARDTMNNASRYIPHNSSDAKSKLSNVLQDQPLVLGAFGLAIGAAIGAAIPITRTEDDWMGSTAHSVRQAAQNVARQEVDELRTVADDTLESVKKSVTEHGLSADNMTDLVRDVGSHAKTAMNQVGGSLDSDKKKG